MRPSTRHSSDATVGQGLSKRSPLRFWALAVVFFGCLPGPPETVFVDPGFSAMNLATIHEALTQWCELVGFCPELVENPADAQGLIVQDIHHGRSSEGHNNHRSQVIRIDALEVEVLAHPEASWALFAHEIGHWGIEGHTRAGLMSPEWDPETQQAFCIDDAAVTRWCQQQDCAARAGNCE